MTGSSKSMFVSAVMMVTGFAGCTAAGGEASSLEAAHGGIGRASNQGLIEKGYTYNKVDEADNIKLVYDNAPDWMRQAFRDAAHAWTAADTTIYVSEGNNGPEILVIAVDGWDWSLGESDCPNDPNHNVTGCTLRGAPGQPGTIYMPLDKNAIDNPGRCDWTDQALLATATHEMGHALGFKHPGEGSLIDNTCSAAEDCPSIMWQPSQHLDENCNPLYTDLQPDDIASALEIYGPRE